MLARDEARAGVGGVVVEVEVEVEVALDEEVVVLAAFVAPRGRWSVLAC